MSARKTLEVHEHYFIRGPRANGRYGPDGKWQTGKFSHSHAEGNRPHGHTDTGPSSYVIDKDDWYRSTGLRGGGRKKFTTKPSGEQFAIEELEDWQKSFEVILGEPTPAFGEPGYLGEGPGIALPLRIAKAFHIPFTVKDGRK